MRFHRRTAPKVIGGKVQRQNRTRGEPDYTATHQIRIDREKARPGYRHFVSPADVSAFLALLPDWRELAIGLQRVVLDNNTSCYGWHQPGTVALCNWEEDRLQLFDVDFFNDHAATLARLCVPSRRAVLAWDCEKCCAFPTQISQADAADLFCINCNVEAYDLARHEVEEYYRDRRRYPEEGGIEVYLVEWNDQTVQAFQLIHVLVHELGHHHDRMTSPRQRGTTRGERYAEEYALRHEEAIWAEYRRVFRIA